MRPYAEVITGSDFKRMIAGAYHAFLREHEYINNLNVFPVPDGDTGTNMLLTLRAVAKAVADAPETSIGALSKRAADSAIMGARGNSGVILSQLFRGIARGLGAKKEATSSELGKAFQYGVLYAYRAVARPVEGTILTVAKGIAKGARRAVRDSRPFVEILNEALLAGRAEVQRTPELLPVLKSAGVVDAGGQGLIVFLTGCLDGLGGACEGPEANLDRSLVPANLREQFNIAHPYCTEFMVKKCALAVEDMKRQLSGLGDSLVLAGGDELVKVHIHTAHPGMVLESALTWGSLHNIKIDNMADQHSHSADHGQQSGEIAVVAVVAGSGLTNIMRGLGAEIIIAGGQTMNPPVEDFIDAIHSGRAQQYILLPNNKNIMLAAAQAKKLLGDKVEIVPTVNIPQGLAAILAFNPKQDMENNIKAMTDRIKHVRAASITVTVRDSMVGGRLVPAGRFIGVVDNNIITDAPDLITVFAGLVKEMLHQEAEVISLYYGADVTEQEAAGLAEHIRTEYPGVDVEIYYGGQPHYQLIISME